MVKICTPQFRYVYPSASKNAVESRTALNHFVNPKDGVETIYTDNSNELKAAIGDLGYRHQTSMEYVDSSKSFVEREIRQGQTWCSPECQWICGHSQCSILPLQWSLPSNPTEMSHRDPWDLVQSSVGNPFRLWQRFCFGTTPNELRILLESCHQHQMGECSWDILSSPVSHGMASI